MLDLFRNYSGVDDTDAVYFGPGIILGVLNVFVRDVGQFVNILLQFWFWFTPIVYVSKTLPEWVSGLLAYNPMATIITSYQNVMLYHQSPNWMALLPVTILSLILFLFASAPV